MIKELSINLWKAFRLLIKSYCKINMFTFNLLNDGLLLEILHSSVDW